MQKFDLNRRGPEIGSNSAKQLRFSDAASQQLLEEIGGGPLTGSGFEDEEPESDFAPAGQES
jgi:hypothetical protein